MNNDYSDLQKKLKQESIENASLQGISYTEPSRTPAWISYISWGIGILWGIIIFVVFLQEESTKEEPAKLLPFTIFWTLIAKVIVYWILIIIFSGCKVAKKGAIVVAKKSGEILDSATINMSKRINSAMEKGREQAKAEQEKQILREKVNDLELQNLRNRIAELEKKLHKKK